MGKAISGEEKCFENKNLRRAGILAVLLLAFATGTSVAGAVEGLRLENLTSGELRVEWTAPDFTPSHFLYHVNWRAADEPIAVPAVAVTYSMVTLTLERALYRGLGEDSIGLSNAVPAANRDKLQDRNDLHWRCQGERFAG